MSAGGAKVLELFLDAKCSALVSYCGGPLSAMFSSSFQPPKTGPCHLRPIHISELLQLASRLNFNPLLRLPKMHAKNTNCFLAMNAISCRKT